MPSNSSSLNFGTSTNFSIDAWIHTTQTTTATIIDKRTGTANNPVGYHLFVFGGNLGFQLGDGSPFLNNNSSGPTINDGNWHHVAVTIDRTSTTGGRLYVDGAEVYIFDPTTRPGNISNTADLRIGQRYLSSVQPFQGAIDEVEIFNRARSDSDIKAIFDAGSFGKCKPISCEEATDIVADPSELTLQTKASDTIIVTVTGEDGCPVEGDSVKAKVGDSGNEYLKVSPKKQTTNANGEAVFTINAKKKAGSAVVKFKDGDLSTQVDVTVVK